MGEFRTLGAGKTQWVIKNSELKKRELSKQIYYKMVRILLGAREKHELSENVSYQSMSYPGATVYKYK